MHKCMAWYFGPNFDISTRVTKEAQAPIKSKMLRQRDLGDFK